MPARLFSAGWRGMLEGLGRWALPPGAAPRRLSLGCAGRAKAPPGKKLLSEKRLVSLPAGWGRAPLPPGTRDEGHRPPFRLRRLRWPWRRSRRDAGGS